MNQNTEYEKLAREIYQGLINAEGIHTIDVKHNVKLTGKSGQEHQVDVYWEYEIAGVKLKVIIECKNYNTTVPIGKVRDFFGLLADLTNVSGIMVTKIGYQAGAKAYANYYGIELKELRTPDKEESIIGELELSIGINRRSRLFLIDDQWARLKNINLELLSSRLREILPQGDELVKDGYLPLEITRDTSILDKEGQEITTLDELGAKQPEKNEHIFDFEDAYINTLHWGQVKIRAVKYIRNQTQERKVFAIDARNIIKVILKDVLSGQIKFFDKTGNVKQF
ncbi:MAG TPA: restriction endonuclease [Dysgonomonas sp.]|uniref:restriction endonuclease n=1 Tax=unclassified Dysgonomonas TaxID=2630389 RepID=UPI0025B8BC2F|nr:MULTISPECIES: restriction endonuclease [unclassified Dysgonomonas]HML66110.1 restriction endonuclease [Dysgonomonas sp.]